MNDPKLTNRLLAGILAVLLLQVWMLTEKTVEADTLRLDYCITEKMDQTPEQFLHVISHAPIQKAE